VRALLVVLLVVAAPVLLVWMSELGDATLGARLKRKVEGLAAQSAEDLPEGAAHQLELAVRGGVWLRVYDPASGELLLEADQSEQDGVLVALGDLFFGPDGAPSLQQWDAGRPPPLERHLLLGALESGEASACTLTEDHQLLVCEAALLAPGPPARLIHVQASSRRAIRALYDMRYQLAKLMLFVLMAGLGLGLWLGWRMVRPLELLRRQVVEKGASADLSPVELDRDDEFGDLARAFNQLLAALAARSAANEAFAADLVHELKNPLAAVRAVADSLESGRPVDAERAARLSRALRGSTERLEALARAFLELARAEAGLVGHPREPLDLGELLSALAEEEPPVEGGRVELIAGGPLPVQGDAERLETALRNLIANAWSFAGTEERVPSLRLRAWAEEGAAIVEVEDNGVGLAEDELERVFSRFYSRRPGGTGLGLALVRAIAEAHQGRAWALPGPGGRFRLRLPLRSSQVHTGSPNSSSAVQEQVGGQG
jgi:two-component system sensor histidine kinase ChvG